MYATPIVFVVDDDVSVRESLESLIRCEGWEPETFASAAQFLAYPRVVTPSCLVLDVSLPDLNGLELQKRIATDRADMPIIFISGYGDVPKTVQAMKAGAVDFLMKPLRMDELAQAISSAHLLSVNRQHARAEAQRCQRLLASLTVREREVLRLVLEGRRNKEIAATLDSQESTVKVHRSRVMRKLGVRSIPDLLRIGESGGLPGLLLHDREPVDPERRPRSSESGTGAEPDAAESPNAWFGAAGTWSGFTWPSAVQRTRHHS
jgi:FixJ family two-component response regulator